jgi:hypothetical protein
MGGPETTGLDRAESNAFAGGQLLGVLIFLALRVPQLIRAAQAPAVHEDLAVTTGSLGHQTPAESTGSRCSQVAVALGPAEPGAPELEHAVDVAMKALARLGLGEFYGQMPQLALDVQHWGKIRFSSHETSLSPGTDRKAPRCSVEIGAVERAHFLIKTASVPQKICELGHHPVLVDLIFDFLVRSSSALWIDLLAWLSILFGLVNRGLRTLRARADCARNA